MFLFRHLDNKYLNWTHIQTQNLNTIIIFQAVCEWESESVESWGRRKRSLPQNERESAQEEDMNISQEILVLDFGDERQSTDFLRSDKPGGSASETNFGGI